MEVPPFVKQLPEGVVRRGWRPAGWGMFIQRPFLHPLVSGWELCALQRCAAPPRPHARPLSLLLCPATSPQVHLPHPYIKTTCKKLGVEWADALVGFERRKGMNFPSIQVGGRMSGWQLHVQCVLAAWIAYWLHGLPTSRGQLGNALHCPPAAACMSMQPHVCPSFPPCCAGRSGADRGC